ncbi:MAG: viroplasmin family protein [Pseudobdellovibrio sp.]
MPTKIEKIFQYVIYTDGACSGNPGPGGWGAVVGALVSPDKLLSPQAYVLELGAHAPSTTNNRMELFAVLESLKYIKDQSQRIKNKDFKIQIYTDSVYVIRGITQWVFGWKKNNWKNSSGENVVNQDIWQELDQVVHYLQMQIQNKIKWDYVRGHKGTPGNERCDQIAVAFSKKEYVYLYEGLNRDYQFDITMSPPTEPLPESNWSKTTADKNKTVWYVVLKNGVIARYKSWSECESAVKGAPGVKFKKVSSESEEQQVLKSWGR